MLAAQWEIKSQARGHEQQLQPDITSWLPETTVTPYHAPHLSTAWSAKVPEIDFIFQIKNWKVKTKKTPKTSSLTKHNRVKASSRRSVWIWIGSIFTLSTLHTTVTMRIGVPLVYVKEVGSKRVNNGGKAALFFLRYKACAQRAKKKQRCYVLHCGTAPGEIFNVQFFTSDRTGGLTTSSAKVSSWGCRGSRRHVFQTRCWVPN